MADKSLALMESATPLRLPVPSAQAEKFVTTAIEMFGDTHPILKLLHSSFGAVGTVKFLSLFHGMTIEVQSRNYWATVFRDVHIYRHIRETAKPNRKRAVLGLAAYYKLPAKTVVAIYKKVKAAINHKEAYAESTGKDLTGST